MREHQCDGSGKTAACDLGRQGVIAGELSQCDEPKWQPLLDLIGLELVDWLMWMHEIELEDSSRVHAYKHTATRRYFHIADDEQPSPEMTKAPLCGVFEK